MDAAFFKKSLRTVHMKLPYKASIALWAMEGCFKKLPTGPELKDMKIARFQYHNCSSPS